MYIFRTEVCGQSEVSPSVRILLVYNLRFTLTSWQMLIELERITKIFTANFS